jgi:hypothetical protein
MTKKKKPSAAEIEASREKWRAATDRADELYRSAHNLWGISGVLKAFEAGLYHTKNEDIVTSVQHAMVPLSRQLDDIASLLDEIGQDARAEAKAIGDWQHDKVISQEAEHE